MAVCGNLTKYLFNNKCKGLISSNFGLFIIRRSYSKKPSFGLLFDIDGVIVRGRRVLPSAQNTFAKLIKTDGSFRVPTIFVTNGSNALRHEKAIQLSDWLGVNVTEDQVVMAHSPLRMFNQYHKKHMLISGQGPIKEIAKNIGFTNVTTIDELREFFPVLDAVDHKRRVSVPNPLQDDFPKLDGIVLFGEPVRWETALQLICDVLMTDGMLSKPPTSIIYPHIPILACNMDLQWMAEAPMPRFGHGAFLLCVENLYKKLTGYDLIYSALIGKPSEITYHHAHHMAKVQAKQLDVNLKRLYAIGDNINTDIFGANLYQQYLSQQPTNKVARRIESLINHDELIQIDEITADSCYSILVETGVYSQERSDSNKLDHCPRDFLPVEEKLREPHYTVEDVEKAVNLIFKKENFQ